MGNQRILIVDDDQALTKALRLRCEDIGFEVEVSSDALHATMTMSKDPPDLIVLDINMPGADGFSLCETLATNTQFAPVPVIVLTGQTDPATIERCNRLGAHYLLKDSDTWPHLERLIRLLLEKPSAKAEAPEESESTSPKVLVIDDDPGIPQALEIRLDAYGVEIVSAHSGMQGFWKALKELPAAIITDYTMPDGSGNYIVSRLKRHSLTQHIPIIVLTGRTNDFSIRRAMFNLGVSAFLTKPVDFEALIAELHQYIQFPLNPRRLRTGSPAPAARTCMAGTPN